MYINMILLTFFLKPTGNIPLHAARNIYDIYQEVHIGFNSEQDMNDVP